jgi:hypothetical protein
MGFKIVRQTCNYGFHLNPQRVAQCTRTAKFFSAHICPDSFHLDNHTGSTALKTHAGQSNESHINTCRVHQHTNALSDTHASLPCSDLKAKGTERTQGTERVRCLACRPFVSDGSHVNKRWSRVDVLTQPICLCRVHLFCNAHLAHHNANTVLGQRHRKSALSYLLNEFASHACVHRNNAVSDCAATFFRLMPAWMHTIRSHSHTPVS